MSFPSGVNRPDWAMLIVIHVYLTLVKKETAEPYFPPLQCPTPSVPHPISALPLQCPFPWEWASSFLVSYFAADGFQIELDNKAVKTPAGNPLLVPSEQLAMAIAVEWNSQQEIIKSENMHLVRHPPLPPALHHKDRKEISPWSKSFSLLAAVLVVAILCAPPTRETKCCDHSCEEPKSPYDASFSFFKTSLSNTVIDVPRKRTKAKQVDDILEFLLTDTIW